MNNSSGTVFSETTSNTGFSSTIVESQLDGLLPSVRFAIENRTTVVALQLWQRIPSLVLLPFHLHLTWVQRVEGLSLNAKFGFAPFFASDDAIISSPLSLYGVRDSVMARERARRIRGERQTYLAGDFQIPDWEQGYNNHSEELAELDLPGSSFLGVDVISPSSEIARGNRSVLGRMSVRNALRPTLLIPSRLGVTTASAQLFSAIDLLIINIQGLRGRRTIDTVQKILRVRRQDHPTIIVASSPSDLIRADINTLYKSVPVFVVGSPPRIDEVKAIGIGESRYFEDRNFDFAVEELRGRSERLDYLIDLAKSAWWASHQSLGGADEPELRRFESALEKMKSESTDDVDLLGMGKDIISRVAADGERANLRRRAVSEAAITTSSESGILIVARSSGITKVREDISELLDLPVDSLSTLGVRAESPFSHFVAGSLPVGVVIAAGYFGLPTIDKVLMSGARIIKFVLDATEARAAWFGIYKLINCLRTLNVTEGIEALEKISSGVVETIPAQLRPTASDISVTSDWFDFVSIGQPTNNILPTSDTESTEVMIYFTDGTRMDVSSNTRFDVLGGMGTRLKTITADELHPGDEIVVVNEDARNLFSESLINALDQGPLKAAIEQRQLWLTLVKVQYAMKDIGVQTILTRMTESGNAVSDVTVRSWIDTNRNSETSVPNSSKRFLAFAQALEIGAEKESLLKMFDSIRRVRTGHRVAGRRLGRAIRAAYLDRLDAGALTRIQREWGLDVVELVKSARVAIVDEIVSKGATPNGIG